MGHFRLKISLLFFLAGFLQVQGQKNPVLYGGMELFRHTQFEDNTFGNFNIGSQLYHWKFFAPEVGYSLYSGTFRERSIAHEPGVYTIAPGIYNMHFISHLFTLTPKIKIGKDDAFLSFSPSYHRGSVSATGRYYALDDRRYVLEEDQKKSAPVSFWSFSLGVEGFAIQEEKYWFTLFLTYTAVDAQAALSQLDFTEHGISTYNSTTSTIGFGIRFYFNPFPVEND